MGKRRSFYWAGRRAKDGRRGGKVGGGGRQKPEMRGGWSGGKLEGGEAGGQGVAWMRERSEGRKCRRGMEAGGEGRLKGKGYGNEGRDCRRNVEAGGESSPEENKPERRRGKSTKI